jgi:hypothetical protein
MFWTGIIIGLFLGANAGLVVAGMMAAARRAEEAAQAEALASPMDEAVMDEPAEIEIKVTARVPALTYLDRYPHA